MSDSADLNVNAGEPAGGNDAPPAWFEAYQAQQENILGQVLGRFEALEQGMAPVRKLGRAFSDEDDSPKQRQGKGSPSQAALDQAWLDEFLDTMVAQHAQGNRMPMTTKLGVKAGEIERKVFEQEATIEELKRLLALRSNPQYEADMRTFGVMDNMILSELEELFGEADPIMHDSVAEKVKIYLDQIRDQNPESWEKIRRSENLQARIIKAHVASFVPPKARAMLAAQREAATEITQEEFREALVQVRQLPPELRARAQAIVRSSLFEAATPNKRYR